MPRTVNLEFPPDLQQILFPFIAEAIVFANHCAPDKWGVTPYPTGIRLNAGFIEVLTMMDNYLRLIVDRNTLSPEFVSNVPMLVIEGRDYYYHPVKTSVLIELDYEPLEEFATNLAQAKQAHFALIRAATKGPFNRGSKMGHSSELVVELGRILNMALPLPTYGSNTGVSSTKPSISDETEFIEGTLRRVINNVYERNPQARQVCLDLYGYKCVICKFSFEETYGEIGRGFIHVHHLVPISSQNGEYIVNPKTDLRPVCPNCHAMLHRKDPPLTLDELKSHIN